MPSMPPVDAQLYLPISEQQLSAVLNEDLDFDKSIATFEAPQLASLLILHALPGLPIEQAARAEHLLIRAIELCNAGIAEGGLPEFRSGVGAKLDREGIKFGHGLLDDYGIALLDHELVGWRSYLTERQEWNREFVDRHRQRLRERLQRVALPAGEERLLSGQQSMIYRTVAAVSDDHLHAQGYAGTGKSLLIHALLNLLRGENRQVLVLAQQPRQLRALLANIVGLDQVEGLTFGQLATQITPPDLTTRGRRGRYNQHESRNPMYDDVMVRHLGVHAVSGFSAIQIVQFARRTVFAFCSSGDSEIAEQHLPEDIVDPVARHVVLHHSTELWSATISPAAADFRPPLRSIHRIKLAALEQWRIPAKYTHILLDECHDLSKPLLQILDVSPQAVISFGDEYQHLRGRAHARDNSIKRCVMTQSVRSARAIEAIVNPIIRAHPGEIKEPFTGHRRYRAEVIYYAAAEVPSRPTTILVRDLWELFEWAQRLAFHGLTIRPLSDFARLGQWVEDCIELHSRGTRARDASLFRYRSWDDVRKHLGRHRSFLKMDELLQKGYQREHWSRTTSRIDPRAIEGYALGLIEDVRNLEFPAVMLAPGVVADLWSSLPGVRSAANSLVYVAATRAQHRLLAPQDLRDWIEARGGEVRQIA